VEYLLIWSRFCGFLDLINPRKGCCFKFATFLIGTEQIEQKGRAQLVYANLIEHLANKIKASFQWKMMRELAEQFKANEHQKS
jgi:hypothetical protein